MEEAKRAANKFSSKNLHMGKSYKVSKKDMKKIRESLDKQKSEQEFDEVKPMFTGTLESETQMNTKGFELKVIDGIKLLYFAVSRGAYKGMYIYITDGVPLDATTRILMARLRSEGYAAGGIRSYAEADDALREYLRGKSAE